MLKKDYKCGIITFEKYEGRKDIGSSRIRGEWIANNWENAELFVQGREYDVVIYQKAYWVEHAKLFKGIKILDLCDPDWLHWGYRTVEMIEEVDAVITSTEELAKAVRKFTDKPVVCVPDRIDLNYYKNRKVHVGDAKTAVWFGYNNNFSILAPVIKFLIQKKLNLIVISNKNFVEQSNEKDLINIENIRWNGEVADVNIIKGDFVLNPQAKSGKWKFKSDNKTFLSWALGMPVAKDIEDLKRFISEDERKKEVEVRRKELEDKWDIKYSVKQLKQLINELDNGNTTKAIE